MLLHKRKFQGLLHKILYTVLHIPSCIVENWDASSYTPLLLSSAYLIQDHIDILILEMEFAVLESH